MIPIQQGFQYGNQTYYEHSYLICLLEEKIKPEYVRLVKLSKLCGSAGVTVFEKGLCNTEKRSISTHIAFIDLFYFLRWSCFAGWIIDTSKSHTLSLESFLIKFLCTCELIAHTDTKKQVKLSLALWKWMKTWPPRKSPVTKVFERCLRRATLQIYTKNNNTHTQER